MEFCPVCGRILLLKSEGEKNIGYCNCGFKRTAEINIEAVDNNKNKKNFEKRGEGIVVDKKDIDGIFHICKKCCFDQAEIFDLGSQLADEANVHIFRCLKCGCSERQADGSCNL